MDGFRDVVDHLRSHAGDSLQAVVIYQGENHRDLYRRDDVVQLHGSSLEAEVLADIRSDRRRRRSESAERYEGALRATVRVFDKRVILNLPRDEDSGTVVVLDVVAASDLAAFVADIRSDIYTE